MTLAYRGAQDAADLFGVEKLAAGWLDIFRRSPAASPNPWQPGGVVSGGPIADPKVEALRQEIAGFVARRGPPAGPRPHTPELRLPPRAPPPTEASFTANIPERPWDWRRLQGDPSATSAPTPSQATPVKARSILDQTTPKFDPKKQVSTVSEVRSAPRPAPGFSAALPDRTPPPTSVPPEGKKTPASKFYRSGKKGPTERVLKSPGHDVQLPARPKKWDRWD